MGPRIHLKRRATPLIAALVACACFIPAPRVVAQLIVELTDRKIYEGETIEGRIDDETIEASIELAANTSATFTDGTTFTGPNATFGTDSILYWQQVGILVGKNVYMATGSRIELSGTNPSLTLDANTTVDGDVTIYGSTGSTIINQGMLTHNDVTDPGEVYAATFTNSAIAGTLSLGSEFPGYNSLNAFGGSITADGSGTSIHLAGNWTNSGTITATAGNLSIGTTSTGYAFTNTATGSLTVNGATVYLATPTVNEGRIAVQSGTLNISNTLVNDSLGTISGAGTISGDLTLAGGTLSPGNSIGTLTFTWSDFLVTGASTFSVELNGTTADRITFQNPTSIVNIGAGLLSLSVSLLSAPALGTRYTIMEIASGGTGITGYFSNLPTSGSGFSASFGGVDYPFIVDYLMNSIAIVAVPEPGTYALLALGLGVVAVISRRRWRS